MEFKIIALTASSISVELINEEPYETKNPYHVFLNGELVWENLHKNVFSLFNLVPDSLYRLELQSKMGSGTIEIRTLPEPVALNVRRFNAKGDGQTDDTLAIQGAIMACPKGGRVIVPPGTYRVQTLFLKSDLTLELQKGARLVYGGKPYEGVILPGYTEKPDGGEYYLGSWEGNPLDTYGSLIQGINVENVFLIGEGILDGNGTEWWKKPKEKVGAWRPRILQIIHSKNVVVQGLKFENSPCWTIHPLFSKQLDFIDLSITNPKDSPNTDGLDPESCQDVKILGVHFSVGDDCIAIKSGKIYLGSRLKIASQNMIIRNCSMNFGHGAVVIGSEMAGGAKNIRVSQCLFNETDRGLRIKTRRGRGQDAIVEGIHFSKIKMDKVLTPFVVNSFYFCDPDGHSDYVKTKEALPVDSRTPWLRDFAFEDIECQNSEVAAAFFFGLPERPIEKVILKNCSFSFAKNSKPDYPAMMDDIPTYCRSGLIFKNVADLKLENITFKGVEGQEILHEKVVIDNDSKTSSSQSN